jgi:uncharacterized protein YkwD
MSVKTAAILSALLLAGFLVLRPALGRLGAPETPDVRGRSSVRPPAGASIAPVGLEDEATPPASPAAGGASGAAAAACPGLDAVEKRIFELTNDERRKAGRSPLDTEPVLHDTALAQSSDMSARRFFDHINPDGESPEDRVAVRHRRLIGLVGENIWRGSGFAKTPTDELAREIVTWWMKSPGHRENILRQDSTHLGVGVCGSGGEVWATQNFARVLAYLDNPLPAAVPRGKALALALSPVAAPVRPAAGFDLWSPGRGLAAGPRSDLAGGQAEAEPGVYKLRVYFAADSGHYSIVSGPQLEVQ